MQTLLKKSPYLLHVVWVYAVGKLTLISTSIEPINRTLCKRTGFLLIVIQSNLLGRIQQNGYWYSAQQSEFRVSVLSPAVCCPWPDGLRRLSVQMRAGILWVGFVLMPVQSPDCHPVPSSMIGSAGMDEGLCMCMCCVCLLLCACVSLYDLKVKTLTLIFPLLFLLVSSSFLVLNCFLPFLYFPRDRLDSFTFKILTSLFYICFWLGNWACRQGLKVFCTLYTTWTHEETKEELKLDEEGEMGK